MTDEQATTRLCEAVHELYKEGYVTTGDLQFFKPKERQVEQNYKLHIGKEIKTLSLGVHKIGVVSFGLQDIYNTGALCPSCGSSRIRRSGVCAVCDDCGSTTGCD